jgi:protease-4
VNIRYGGVLTRETKITLWLLSLGALVTLGLVIGISLLFSSELPSLSEEPEWLYLDLRIPLTATPRSAGILDNPSDLPPLTTDMARLIRSAGDDDSILGIRAELGGLGLGWAQVQELRNSLLDYRESGKECKIWGEAFSNKEYYLASACNEVSMPPAGVFLVTGMSMTITYYADLFTELDIQPNFAHVGDFKSAVEPYERTGPSDSASEATNALLDSIYDEFIEGLANGRALQPKAMRAILDNPPITPEGALEMGLVDSLQYRDEFLLKDNEDISFRSWRTYLEAQKPLYEDSENQIAVIYAEGAIMGGSSGSSMFGGKTIGDKSMHRYFQKAIDQDVKAVVLRISSPGGSGSASDAIWRDVQRVKSLGIPVIISMGDYAASGGYYIAMAGDYIFAQPTTITGSIGVFGGKFNLSGLYKKLGMNLHTYKRGEFSTLFSSSSNFTEDERSKYQEFLNGFYNIFITKAAEGRNLSVEQIHEVAQGRVWTGNQALEHKLIDEIGGLNDAMLKAAELAGIEDYSTIQIPQTKSFLEELLEEMSGSNEEVAIQKLIKETLPNNLQESLQSLQMIETMLEQDNRLSHLPMQISID